MKEATGELNATVVVVVAIAGLSAFFFTIIWPQMQNNNIKNTKCGVAICAKQPNNDGTVNCTYQGVALTCPFKG